jgi:hypothetical protein
MPKNDTLIGNVGNATLMDGVSIDRLVAARMRDQKEIEAKRGECRPWIESPGHAIIRDLQQYFHIENPPLQLLLEIAMSLANLIGVKLDRQDKRRRELLIGWFNKHYDRICDYVPRMVLRDDNGMMLGPCIDSWKEYTQKNRHADVLQYLESPV